MKKEFKRKLLKSLNKALELYVTEEKYQHYQEKEEILTLFVERIKNNNNPKKDILKLVCCIDAFYNSGLKYNSSKKGITEASELIITYWNKDLKIKDIISDKEVNTGLIENLNQRFREKNLRGAYSFITKFYHLFNSEYPIYDSLINRFVKLSSKKIGHKVNTKNYSELTQYLNYLKEEIKWKHNLDNFDLSIWTLMKEIKGNKKLTSVSIGKILKYGN